MRSRIAIAALGIALLVGASALAEDQPSAPKRGMMGHGMMMDQDQMSTEGMGSMMHSMQRMMDSCTEMMQTAMRGHRGDQPAPAPDSDKKN